MQNITERMRVPCCLGKLVDGDFILHSVYIKGANMNIYKEKICTNCANNNCTHKIEEVQEDKATVIKCNDFICKEKRKKVPRNW